MKHLNALIEDDDKRFLKSYSRKKKVSESDIVRKAISNYRKLTGYDKPYKRDMKRKARCSYYGHDVKTGSYNANCCTTCKVGMKCQCEQDSSPSLWFFKSKPDKEYDEFYCGCYGCD